MARSNVLRAEPVAVWKARKFIAEHLDEEVSLARVADLVNLNANYFSEKFKEVTGVNFVRYVARERVAKARDLLRNPDCRVTEVAFTVGFQSISQFNRMFKTVSGKSPTEIRAIQRKERACLNGVADSKGAELQQGRKSP